MLLVFAALVPLGCTASANVNVKGGADAEGQIKDYDKPVDSRAAFSEDDYEDDDVEPGLALLGARQDLFFNGPPTASCKCLNVALGQGPDPAFGWETSTPQTDVETQLVVALDAAPCKDAELEHGVSYRGYRVDGPNVVVQIEPAHPGRPKTVGAIIPRPFDDGGVFVEGPKDMVHGRSPSGSGLCSVGSPGPRRSSETSDPNQPRKTKQIFEVAPKEETRESLDPEHPADAAEPEEK